MSLNYGQQRTIDYPSSKYMSIDNHGGMILSGEDGKSLRKTRTTYPISTQPGASPVPRGERITL
jgi:hypothetical protein